MYFSFKLSCFGNLTGKKSVLIALTHSDERLHLRAKSSNRMPSIYDPTLSQLVDMMEYENMMRRLILFSVSDVILNRMGFLG